MKIRDLALAALALLPVSAQAQAFTDAFGRMITCTGSGPVTCSSGDGTTVQAQTPAKALGTFDGMAPSTWVPPTPPTPTTISSLAFINRFTPQEQATLTAANPLWGIRIAAAQTIDVTNADLLTEIQAAVTAGALTQARATQILNLSVSSP